jgi:hypothetical protein
MVGHDEEYPSHTDGGAGELEVFEISKMPRNQLILLI